MSRVKFIILSIMCVSVASCSLFQPFVDRRRNAGVWNKERLYVGESKENAPAICYNGLITDFAKLQEMADDECQKNGKGSHAVFDRETKFSCRLFLPSHVYFKCEE